MNILNEKIQNEMDSIVVKTIVHVQTILQEQGQEKADELILMIAEGIRKELMMDDKMSETDIGTIIKKFIKEINAALSQNKH